MMRARISVITISDGVVARTREDSSGPAICAWVEQRGSTLVEHVVVADDRGAIRRALERLSDEDRSDAIITTGGTGLTVRDVTPEATRDILHREVPGIAERIRHAGAASTPYAALSRGVAGARNATLIVNLPGSVGGVRDGLAVLDEVIDHAVQLLRGIDTHSHEPPGHGNG
jgi:molybdenum cofactor synthesis domain-containing protein